MENLWERISKAKEPLLNFEKENGPTACIYPTPYDGKSEVVRWFYSRNNGCQIFYACSKEVSDKIDEDSWADVSNEFTLFVEHQLMPHCVENTYWDKCSKYGFMYNKKIPKSKRAKGEEHFEYGCEGSLCHCQPFGEGDFTNGIAEEREFVLQ